MSEESREVNQGPSFEPGPIGQDQWPSAVRPCVSQVWEHALPEDSGANIHEGLELGAVIKGGIEVGVGAHSFSVKSGDVWLLDMWEPHRWKVTEPKTRTLCLLFIPEFIGEEVLAGKHWQSMFTCAPPERPSVPDPERRGLIRNIACEIADEAESKRAQWLAVVRLCLAKLLVLLERSWDPQDAAHVRHTYASATFDRIMPALMAIRSRPSGRLSLGAASAMCDLSTAQFSRVFAQAMGLSYGRFHIRAHLTYAAHLLVESDLSIDAVAERSGFTDASHLHRHFVRHYELTPGEFRLQSR